MTQWKIKEDHVIRLKALKDRVVSFLNENQDNLSKTVDNKQTNKQTHAGRNITSGVEVIMGDVLR